MRRSSAFFHGVFYLLQRDVTFVVNIDFVKIFGYARHAGLGLFQG